MTTATDLKEQGNRFFSSRKYDDAITAYSKAILKNPNAATYFTNRALCYLKMKQWDMAAQDCKRALDVDRILIKGHFFLGQAQVELGQYDEGIVSLNRAYDLAKDQKLNYGDDITSALRVAKRRRWSMMEERRIKEEIELQTYLNRLVMDDKDRIDILEIATDDYKYIESSPIQYTPPVVYSSTPSLNSTRCTSP